MAIFFSLKDPTPPQSLGKITYLSAYKSKKKSHTFLPTTSAEVDRLISITKEKEQMVNSPLWASDLLFFTHNPKLATCLQLLDARANSVTNTQTPQNFFKYCVMCSDPTYVAALDIDGFQDPEDFLAPVIVMRKENPELPVLLMSRHFKSSQFSLERRLIADASLRLPCSLGQIETGLHAARENATERLSPR